MLLPLTHVCQTAPVLPNESHLDPQPATDPADPSADQPDDFSTASATALARSLKALADPIRLRLLSLIGSHPAGTVSVFELTQAFHVTGPTLSHHLRVLREAGLISAERRGTWVYYSLVPEGLAAISGVLGSTFPTRPVNAPS